MKIFHYFPKSISLLFTLMLLVGAVAAGCSDKDRDLYSEMAQKVDVYVDVSGLELAYDELYAQFDKSAAERGEDAGDELVRLSVDESGKALLAEQVPVGSLLRFKLFFMMEDGTEAGCYDKLANGVTVARGDGRQYVIPVDEVMPPEPVPEPSPTVSPEPSPSPSASPSASPTPEPSPSPSGSPEPSPSPSASPEPDDGTVDVYLKLEGVPDVETIRAYADDWRDDGQYDGSDEDAPIITLDEDGVSTEPVATKKKAGDKLALAVYLGQNQIGVVHENNTWKDDPEAFGEEIYFFYENFSAEEGGTGVTVPEGQGGKSVIVLKYGEEIEVNGEPLVIFDLSGLPSDWSYYKDTEGYDGPEANYLMICLYEDNDKDNAFGFKAKLRKKGDGYAPIYMHDVGTETEYSVYYGLYNVEVDENGDPVRDGDGQTDSSQVTGGNDTLLLEDGETEKTVKLTDDDFWS